MNIFRDLVEELKEENLLEETVIDPVSESEDSVDTSLDAPEQEDSSEAALPAGDSVEDMSLSEDQGDPVEAVHATDSDNDSAGQIVNESAGFDTPDSESVGIDSSKPDLNGSDSEQIAVSPNGAADLESLKPEENSSSESAQSQPKLKVRSAEEERQFYKQRAMDEVTGLQLVEHVLTGVEREQMKSSPKTFDDLAVKRALHDFLKVADNVNSPEHSQAEFQLMQETENWASALSRRDRNISVAHLRRYCETTKPSLSSQAMISLARFYRNSPYSESVRSKFDLVFTKLFSKDIGDEKRAVVFESNELVKHIQELYADWASVPLYSTAEDDPDLLLSALNFQDFIGEAENADSFDELVKKDFFKRLKVFKEKANENFFAPILVAAAVESNVAVGNRYVELIEAERQQPDSGDLGEKYGIAHDNSISDATSKTLELLELLQTEKPDFKPAQPALPAEKIEPEVKPVRKTGAAVKSAGVEEKIGGVNKWLIVTAVVLAIITAWFYFGQSGLGEVDPVTLRGNGTAKEFKLEGTFLDTQIHSARISKNTLYGITRESWSDLTTDEKTRFIQKTVELGDGNEFIKVHFLDGTGKSVAFGSKKRVKIY